MQHLEGSGTPVLYIGRKVLKGFVLHRQHNMLHKEPSIMTTL